MMHDFLQALPTAASNPFAFVGYLIVIAAWVTVRITTVRSKAVSQRLQSIPEADRLTALKLEYGLQPRKGLKADEFLRHRRQLILLVAYIITCIVGLAIVAMALGSSAKGTAHLVMEELPIGYRDSKYVWSLQLSNPGQQIAVIDSMRFHVLKKQRHPVTDAHHVTGAAISEVRLPDVFLDPQVESIPVIQEGQYAFPSSDIQRFTFAVGANHAPHEGWIYDAQMEVKWHVPGSSAKQSLVGKVYRLGWPGEPNPPEIDWGALGMKPFVDEVVVVVK